MTRRPPSAAAATTRPPPPQPGARALPLLLGSGPSPFEATRQPSSGRPTAEDLRTNPLTGTDESDIWQINPKDAGDPTGAKEMVQMVKGHKENVDALAAHPNQPGLFATG